MKVRTLQFGKALGAALFVLLLSVVGMKNALAQTLVATLKHGDDISFYYGANALVDAHEDAETGDIITLSSGTFAPTEITKAITLRGAGCVEDTISGVKPTIIPQIDMWNYVKFNVDNVETNLIVEGIYFPGQSKHSELHSPRFIKCNFGDFSYDDGSMDNAQFINCVFNSFNFYQTSQTTLINCVIWNGAEMSYNAPTITAFNSIIRLKSQVGGLSAYNCLIIRGTQQTNDVEGYSVAYNCIGIKNGINTNDSVFNVTTYNCMEVNSLSDVFETFTGDFYYEEPFILNEEIATGFLGDDGTEVGIHGGYMPYDSRPSYQIVRHYSVPKKSDNEGLLNVEIEVYTEEGE